jgi:hypothetical protein
MQLRSGESARPTPVKQQQNYIEPSKKSHCRFVLVQLARGRCPAATQRTGNHVSNDWAQSTAYSYNGDPLPDYLVRLRSSVYRYKGSADIDQPVTFSARVDAVSRSGVRRLRIRNFQFLSDGPRSMGELNLGAGSWPPLVGVLGNAVAEEYLLQG